MSPESASGGPAVEERELRLQGEPVSPGIAVGELLLLEPGEEFVPRRQVEPDLVPAELARFAAALGSAVSELQGLRQGLREGLESTSGAILEAHVLMLQDQAFRGEVENLIRGQRLNAEAAFADVCDVLMQAIGGKADAYSRERTSDIRDIRRRVLRRMLGQRGHVLAEIARGRILVAPDLAPSDTMDLQPGEVLGFATQAGGPTSHTAIVARSLGIPAVTGIGAAPGKVRSGQKALLDGYTGLLILDPSAETLARFGQIQVVQQEYERMLSNLAELPSETRDGYRIALAANIDHPGEAGEFMRRHACGVGLFRTEFLFMGRDTLPSEEEQFRAYRDVVQRMAPDPVILRTLDIGGDKFVSSISIPLEMNPFLGWRGIRLCLQQRDLFVTQLRAMLRTSAYGFPHILFPLVSGIDEVREARCLLEEVREQLEREGAPLGEHVPVGAMIEVPSAAFLADLLAREVDFFSIGTNDLIQYTLAVDRVNSRISHLYEPAHPAILRLIKGTVAAGHSRGIWVGVCGEMGGEPLLVPLLIGLGVDELSMALHNIPAVKYAIRASRLPDCHALAEEALACTRADEVRRLAWQNLQETVPDLASFLHRSRPPGDAALNAAAGGPAA